MSQVSACTLARMATRLHQHFRDAFSGQGRFVREAQQGCPKRASTSQQVLITSHLAGERYVTFNGIAKACAKAGGFPEPEIINYYPKVTGFLCCWV
jgi:hypothetical protein